MLYQFSDRPSEDEIYILNYADCHLIDHPPYNYKEAEITEFYYLIDRFGRRMDLSISRDHWQIPATFALMCSLWNAHTQINSITPKQFLRKYRATLALSGASQSALMLFGLSPVQVNRSRWTSADRIYLSDNLERIAKNLGKESQLITPSDNFFRKWRNLLKLKIDFFDLVLAMPPGERVFLRDELHKYIFSFPEKKFLCARATLPSDLF